MSQQTMCIWRKLPVKNQMQWFSNKKVKYLGLAQWTFQDDVSNIRTGIYSISLSWLYFKRSLFFSFNPSMINFLQTCWTFVNKKPADRRQVESKRELVWMYLLIIISFVTSIFPAWVGFSPQCLKIEMKGNLNLTVFVQTKKPNHISKKKKKQPSKFCLF